MRSWKPEDLDRCEHGRHSIDNCFDCPGGQSTGNLYGVERFESRRPSSGSGLELRIGTMLHGEPIWVAVHRGSREDTGITIDSGDGPPRSITVQEVLDEEKGMP